MEKIVDEEMRRIGASKLQMPTLLSSRLWRKSGRMEVMGSEVSEIQRRQGKVGAAKQLVEGKSP